MTAGMNPGQKLGQADVIRQLWNAGGMSKRAIARSVGCSPANVTKIIATMEGAARIKPAPASKPVQAKTCQRPDVANGLKPCGRPLHVIAGETMGVCQHHWEIGRPITGQKLGVSETW